MTVEEALKSQAVLAVEEFTQREEFQALEKMADDDANIEWLLRSSKRLLVQYIISLNIASKFDVAEAKRIVSTTRKLSGEVMGEVLDEKMKAPVLRLV